MLKWLSQNPFWGGFLLVFGGLFLAYAAHQMGVKPADVAGLRERLEPVASALLGIGLVVFALGLLRGK